MSETQPQATILQLTVAVQPRVPQLPASVTSIQEEEALIRAYEAELNFLKQKRQAPPEPKDDNDIDSLDDLFLQLRQSTPDMKIATGSDKTECLALTQSVQDFIFTSVEDKTTARAVPTVTSSKSKLEYVLKGHFVSNSAITACITMATERQPITSSSGKTMIQRKRKRDGSSRVVNLTCKLQSSTTNTGEDTGNMSALESLAARYAHKNSISDWTQRVSGYLKHEKKQKEALDRWNATAFQDCYWSKDKESLRVKIYPGGLPKQNILPTFSWGWNWKAERDTLGILTTEGSFDLSPKGLQDLVTVAGGCEEALEMILKAIN